MVIESIPDEPAIVVAALPLPGIVVKVIDWNVGY